MNSAWESTKRYIHFYHYTVRKYPHPTELLDETAKSKGEGEGRQNYHLPVPHRNIMD